MPPTYDPPKVRVSQTWTRFWQRYYGEAPHEIRDYNTKVGPATRRVISQIGKDGPVPKTLLGKTPPLAFEASAGGGVGAAEIGKGLGKGLVFALPALGALVAFLVAWGVNHAWKATFGAVFSYIGNFGLDYDKLFVHIHIKPLSFVKNLNIQIQNNLSAIQKDSERAFVWTVNMAVEPFLLLVGTVLAIGYALWYLGRATEHAIAHRIPKNIHETIVKPVQKIARGALTALTNRVTKLEHDFHHLRPQVTYIAKTALYTPKSIGLRLGRVETRLLRDEHNIAQLQHAVSGKGFAGNFFHMLPKTGLEWLRCRNVSRLGRAICKMNPNLLRYLLGTAFEAFAVLDLCALIKAEVALAEWFQPLLMDLVDVDEWLIKNCGYQKAPDLTLPTLTLPAEPYGLTLNGPRDKALGLT